MNATLSWKLSTGSPLRLQSSAHYTKRPGAVGSGVTGARYAGFGPPPQRRLRGGARGLSRVGSGGGPPDRGSVRARGGLSGPRTAGGPLPHDIRPRSGRAAELWVGGRGSVRGHPRPAWASAWTDERLGSAGCVG